MDGNVHLVISKGNVNVPSSVTNFEGVIICDGKLTCEASYLTCTRNAEVVLKCLQFAYDDGTQTRAIASCLEGGGDFVYASQGDGYSGANSLAGLVTYENWKKE